MRHRKTSRAIAVVAATWMIAVAAAFALATSSDDAAAQRGCRGGGASPSPSGSPSASPGGSTFPPSIPPSIPPNPLPDAKKAPHPAGVDPWVEVPVLVAQQGVTCKSTITIAYKSSGQQAFKGKVGSGEDMCKRARRVAVKKVKRGKDQTIGRAVTNARGAYTVPEENARGRYYAVVSKATTENDDGETVTCQAARSKTIRP
ncbi:MAG: hypothetical protein ABR613_09725 [Actinomycetota bacterium]